VRKCDLARLEARVNVGATVDVYGSVVPLSKSSAVFVSVPAKRARRGRSSQDVWAPIAPHPVTTPAFMAPVELFAFDILMLRRRDHRSV